MPLPTATDANRGLLSLQSQVAGGAQRVFSKEGVQEAALFGKGVEFQWNGEAFKDLAGRRLRNFLAIFGLVAESSAKQVTPYKTGTLRRSIHSTVLNYNGRSDQSRAEKSSDLGGTEVMPTAEKDGFSILLGSWVNYAIFVELGTSRVAQRPFLRTGLADASTKIPQIAAKARSS